MCLWIPIKSSDKGCEEYSMWTELTMSSTGSLRGGNREELAAVSCSWNADLIYIRTRGESYKHAQKHKKLLTNVMNV
jgi:hypothetical protein